MRAFLHCVDELTDGEVDFATPHRALPAAGDVQVRAYPISVDPAEFERLAASDEVREQEASVLAGPAREDAAAGRSHRPVQEHRARLRAPSTCSCPQHPEWRGRVTMLALLDPSRPEIPEYAEYVGAIQRAAREVNDRWYSTGIGRRSTCASRTTSPQAVAAYKHYDVLLVNAIFDGMNLVAKEAPLVNERDGVLILSENAGVVRGAAPLGADRRQPVRHPAAGGRHLPGADHARRGARARGSRASASRCATTTSAAGSHPAGRPGRSRGVHPDP